MSADDKRQPQPWFIALALCALSIAVYAGVFRNDFVDLDDNVYITNNPAVRAGLTWPGFRYAWTTFDTGNWIPLTWLTFELDAALHGIDPRGFHATNLLLHAMNAVLLFLILRQYTRETWPSAIVTALFTVHPMHVESVAWAAERKDVFSTCWFLLTLLAYERYAARPDRWRGLWVLLPFAFGLLSKSMVVTTPVLLLLLDYWPLGRVQSLPLAGNATPRYPACRWQSLLIEKLPMFAMSLAIGVTTIYSQSQTAAMTAIPRLPLMLRFGNAFESYGWYLLKTIWPTDLCVFYVHPLDNLSWMGVGGSALVLFSCTSLAILYGRQRPYLLVGWFWYLITLLPVIGILQVGAQAHADRYSYLPQIGLLVLIIWELKSWLPSFRWSYVGLTAVAIAAFAVLTGRQVSYWRDTATLWRRALEVDPHNWFAHFQSGALCLERQELDDAARHFEQVRVQRPNSDAAALGEGWIQEALGNWEKAGAAFQQAAELNPGSAEAWFQLSRIQQRVGDLGAAEQSVRKCIELKPHDSELRNELGVLLIRQSRTEEALRQFQRSIQLRPADASAYLNSGLALCELNRPQAAEENLRLALALDPANVPAHLQLGILLQQRGDSEGAAQEYMRVLESEPAHPGAMRQLKKLSGNEPAQ